MWQTTYNSLEISVRQCQLFGLIQFKLSQIGIKSKYFNTIINILLQMITYLACVLMVIFYTRSRHLATLHVTLFVLNGQSLLHFSTIMISSLKFGERHVNLLNEISRFGMKMHEKGFTINSKMIRKQMIWICIFKLSMNLCCIFLRFILHNFHDTESIRSYMFIYVTYCLPIILNYFLTILLINYVLYIRMAFKTLNTVLENLVNDIATIENNKYNKLSEICMLYHELGKIVDIFNKTFGLKMLSLFWYCFCSITCSVYLLFIGITKSNTDMIW